MRHLFASLIILAMLSPAALWAQDDPAPDVIRLRSQNGSTLSVDVPDEWQSFQVAPEVDQYGTLNNRTLAEPPQITEVQAIIRPAVVLSDVIEQAIDTTAQNPALDYLQRYAAWRTERGEGFYDTPQAIENDDIIGGAMLYVEELDGNRYGPDAALVLSLALVFYLGEGDLGIILLDGDLAGAEPILDTWQELLPRIQVNAATPEFADDPAAFLAEFASVEALIAGYEGLQAEIAARPTATPMPTPTLDPRPDRTTPNSRRIAIGLRPHVISVDVPDDWNIFSGGDVDNSAELLKTDGTATIIIDIVPVPEGYESPEATILAAVEADENLYLPDRITPFVWDGLLPSAYATVRPPDMADGAFGYFIAELPDAAGLLTVIYFQNINANRNALDDWRAIMASLRYNELDLSNEIIGMLLFIAPPNFDRIP